MSHHLQVIHVKDGASFRKLEIPYNKKIGAGCETLFLPISRVRALKVFFDKKNAQNSLKRQRKAAEHGLGPKVYSDTVFEVILPLGFEGIFSSKIEREQEILNILDDNFAGEETYGYYTQRVPMVKDEDAYTEKEVEKLEKALAKIFPALDMCDSHCFNLARKNKKLILVDFGDESSL